MLATGCLLLQSGRWSAAAGCGCGACGCGAKVDAAAADPDGAHGQVVAPPDEVGAAAGGQLAALLVPERGGGDRGRGAQRGRAVDPERDGVADRLVLVEGGAGERAVGERRRPVGVGERLDAADP